MAVDPLYLSITWLVAHMFGDLHQRSLGAASICSTHDIQCFVKYQVRSRRVHGAWMCLGDPAINSAYHLINCQHLLPLPSLTWKVSEGRCLNIDHDRRGLLAEHGHSSKRRTL